MKQILTLTGRSIVLWIIAGCVLSFLTMVLGAQLIFHQAGFPLDDAWIYQVYARNLAQTGQWAFVPGVPSTGSTSVLWTLLVTPAYLLGIDGRVWTLGLGLLSLVAGALGAASLIPDGRPGLRLAAGLAAGFEWHLVWAAASGMETMLFAAMLIWFWSWLNRREWSGGPGVWKRGLFLGLWGGALSLARPEGILAPALVGLYALIQLRTYAIPPLRAGEVAAGRRGCQAVLRKSGQLSTWRSRLVFSLAGGMSLILCLLPFIALNYSASGTPWPNTFAAKQTEYAVLLAAPFVTRLAEQVSAVWIGPQVALLPACLVWLWGAVRNRRWSSLLPVAWGIIHLGLYAARLPVTYQHARYAIPVIPVLLVMGVQGMASLLRPQARQSGIRVASAAWALTSVVLFPGFLLALAVQSYARDIAFIQTEMVATANWINANTRPSQIIAVHDIGALGYYAPRPIVDLAGLISPEVTPFMTDDEKLSGYIRAKHADYLVVFPGWSAAYARLVARPEFCKVWAADQSPGYVPYSPAGALTVYRVVTDQPCDR